MTASWGGERVPGWHADLIVAAMMGLGATTKERWMKKQQLLTQERGSGLANNEICQMRVFNLRFCKGVDVFCDFAWKNCGKSSRLLIPILHTLSFLIPSRISFPFPSFPLEQPSSIHAFPLEYLLYIVAPSVRCVEQIGIDAPSLLLSSVAAFAAGGPSEQTGSNNV